MAHLSGYGQGNQFPFAEDFTDSKYEIQLQYNTGWETIESPSPLMVSRTWSECCARWKTMKMRVLRDGKRVRINKFGEVA